MSAGKWRVGEASFFQGDEGWGTEKSHAFSMPFKTAWKKSSCHMDGSNEDGYSFGSMMCMMMHQSWMELEQWECQNKQKEHQHKIDAELREHKYQLCCEEMEIACKEACV